MKILRLVGKYCMISLVIFHATVLSAQIIPGTNKRSEETNIYVMPIDSVILLKYNIHFAFKQDILTNLQPSEAAPVYMAKNGFPVYANDSVNALTGKYNYQQQFLNGFHQLPDSINKQKAFTNIFYKEGDFREKQLSVLQWLPLNEKNNFLISFNSHSSLPEYFQSYTKDEAVNIHIKFFRKISRNGSLITSFGYFRNPGHDYTGTYSIPSPDYLYNFQTSFHKDYSKSFSVKYQNNRLTAGAEFVNTENKAKDIFYKTGNTVDTIQLALSAQIERYKSFIDVNITKNLKIGAIGNNYYVYQSGSTPRFYQYTWNGYIKAFTKNFAAVLNIKKADLFPWTGEIILKGRLRYNNTYISSNMFYRSFNLPLFYPYLLPQGNFDFYKWQRIAGAKFNLSQSFTENIKFSGYFRINIPVNYTTGFLSGNYKNITANYYATGLTLQFPLWKLNNYLSYEYYSPLGTEYITKYTAKIQANVSPFENIDITGHFLLAYFPNYRILNYFYTTNEFIFTADRNDALISLLYLTMPVKSAILFTEWSNLAGQNFTFTNYNYFSFLTFKFGVIWRLWE